MNQARRVIVGSVLAAGWVFIPWEARCPDVDIMEAQGIVMMENGRFVQVWDAARGMSHRIPRGYGNGFLPLPKKEERPKVETDIADLRNGDKLSGAVESISDGFLLLRSQLMSKAVKIPVRNVRQISFKDRESTAREPKGTAIFANGDHVMLNVKGFDGEVVVAETIFCGALRIRREHLAGLVFGREPRVIYKGEFTESDRCGFKDLGGRWGVSEGKFGPLSDSPDSATYLKLRQEGHVRYEWEVSTEARRIRHARFFFFAQTPDYHASGNSYHVEISGRSVYVYRTIQNNVQHVASTSLPGEGGVRRFEVDYNSGKGIFRLKVDGKEVTAGVFSPAIPQGDYVIVTGQSKDRFDNILVRQVMDTILPAGKGESEGEDCVSLVNGDRLSGKVSHIGEGNIEMNTGYCGEPLGVPIQEVASVRFGGEKRESEEELAAISFRIGDRLSGEIIGLTEGLLRIRSPHLGDVDLDVNDVASVVFPGEGGIFEPEETGSAEADVPGRFPPGVIQMGPGEFMMIDGLRLF